MAEHKHEWAWGSSPNAGDFIQCSLCKQVMDDELVISCVNAFAHPEAVKDVIEAAKNLYDEHMAMDGLTTNTLHELWKAVEALARLEEK